MNMRKKTLLGITAAAAFAMSAAAAMAATATAYVNVRTGPGTGNAKVDVLSPGENVDIRECRSGWCYVVHNGPDGWVSANYLDRGSSGGSGGSSDDDDPDVSFSFGIGPDGPSFGFSVGDQPNDRPVRQAQACFYEHFNYKGRSFCIDEGRSVRSLRQGWNDRISSVRLIGADSVRMCEDDNYNGFCRTAWRNQPQLGNYLNDEISSIRVN